MKLLVALLLTLISVRAHASAANAVNLVIDLEAKITQQIKTQIQSVDPDAVVSVNIALKPTDTELLGTQMQAVGLFANGANTRVDDEDIQSVDVTLMSSLDPFPSALTKVIETTVRGISKKSKLQIVKMDASIAAAIEKNKEYLKSNQDYQKANAEHFDKVSTLADDAGHALPGLLAKLLGAVAILQFIVLFAGNFLRAKSMNQLGARLSELKLDGSAGGSSNSNNAPAPIERERSNDAKPGGSASLTTKENPFKGMPIASILALFSDCYWCENDAYAAWAWQQLGNDSKIQLLENWPYAEIYCRYLGTLEPKEESFHLDAAYLKPEPYSNLSNPDLLAVVRAKKSLWRKVAPMRRKAFPIDLQERIALLAVPISNEMSVWPMTTSTARTFAAQIDVARLTAADEEHLYAHPDILSNDLRRQFPSLVWVALLDVTARAKVLESVPAQSLAEIWRAPEAALAKIREALPEKKLALVNDYAKKALENGQFNENSPWLKSLSDAALLVLESAKNPGDGVADSTSTVTKLRKAA